MAVAGCQRFAGRIACVTGGSTGIGAAIVRRIVAEGGRAAIFDVQQEEGIKLAKSFGDPSKALFVKMDVRGT
jgi:3-hydroxyacyl-CoA dehydrogenase/3-hydroxy-2-methylbutyryl-CoA dehydrogenase